MELSCESVRYPEERRPVSCKFVELHVLYVPDDQWNVKLNKVPAEAIESFISAGFIRVFPDVTLKTLRNELGSLLGADKSINKFSFLKCVGRSLALVKGKQEKDLKVKTFAPPYAPQPELYLLPAAESGSSVCSRSLSPDSSSSSPDHPTYYHSAQTCSLPTRIKEPVKFPLIPQSSHPPPPTPSLEEEEEEEEGDEDDDEDDDVDEEEEEEEEEHSYSSTEGQEEEVSSNRPEWPEQQCCLRKTRNQRASQLVSLNKGHDTNVTHAKESPEKGESGRKKKQYHRKVTGDSGVAESLEEAESSLSPADGQRKTKEGAPLKPTTEPTQSPAVSSPPVQRVSPPPPGPDMALVPHKAAAAPPLFQTNREELIEEIKLVREERKQLEWTRQELLRKGKDLLAQNRHRRNQARDSWKKKYFETKKATAPLEENLRKLRQELETFYNKLLHQLQARDHRGKPRRHGRTSIKNELIIQIMTESHEIDDLKRKIEDAKMKLVTEIKLRKQAATELRALKAELAQKKSQSCLLGPAVSLGFGHTTSRVRTKNQNTAV